MKLSLSSADVQRLLEARHHDPFAVLGPHHGPKTDAIRVFRPRSRRIVIESDACPMQRVGDTDLFEWLGDLNELPQHYQLKIESDNGHQHQAYDPYSFGPLLAPDELQAFNAGVHSAAQNMLGANYRLVDGIAGTLFSVWAPHAERVSVVGDFNQWDGRCHTLRVRGESGVWELFVPGLEAGNYKFEIRPRIRDEVLLKADPYARSSELRPQTASLITGPVRYKWQDADWLTQRRSHDWRSSPHAAFEVHLGSWRRNREGTFLDYRTIAVELAAYVKALGFTHIELLPVNEHPLDESWGYQATGYFSPTSRFGSPDDFRWFVDHFHQQGIGVLLDWVPAHFPRDAHALARFDGESLYEYFDTRKAEHRDWGTLVFDYERNEVKSFLISSALYWLEEFHIDGLRVDAVASMLYLDFSRQSEDWVPNRYGGNQNIEAVDFIRQLNSVIAEKCPDCLMIAEESTDWRGVTEPTASGGLGFHLKWNMGWMNDTLRYIVKDPIHRKHHQHWLTFGPTYAFNENFILPLSHDEVVHLKRSLLGKMPGDEWQQFANLRLLYTYQWTFPGKKLLFMGGEFAQLSEWNASVALEWGRLEQPAPRGISKLLQDLNQLHRTNSALSVWDCDSRGFNWINGDDKDHSILAFMRHSPDKTIVAVLNFTPVVRHDYRIGVPAAGSYQELFNSDARDYGGSDLRNRDRLDTEAIAWHGHPQSLYLSIPALSGVMLTLASENH